MQQKTERRAKKSIANFFGSLGYLLCFLQWFWVVMLYFSVIQSIVPLLISSGADKQVEQPSGLTFTPPSSLEMIILAIVTIAMIVITIYALIKIPMGIVKTSNKVVHKTAEAMAPMVIKAQHKKDTKKFHARITVKLTFALKLLLIVLPIALTVASGLLEKQSIDFAIAMVIGCGLAALGVLFFAAQYLLANLLHVKMSDLW